MSGGSRDDVGRFTVSCTSIQFLCLIFLVSCPIFVDKCTSAPLTKAPYPPLRGPSSPMGKAVIRGCRFSRIVKANTGYVEKKDNDGQSLPLEGKVASEASRIGFWRYKREWENASQTGSLRKHPSAVARSPFPKPSRLVAPL